MGYQGPKNLDSTKIFVSPFGLVFILTTEGSILDLCFGIKYLFNNCVCGGGGGQLLTHWKHPTIYLVSMVSCKLSEMLLPCETVLFFFAPTLINRRMFCTRTISFIDVEKSGLLEIYAMSSSTYLP